MEPVNTNQYRAFKTGRLPDGVEFAEGVWAIAMALPARMPGGGQSFSYAYMIDDFSGQLHVIDPGWDLPDNLTRWERFFEGLGRSFDDVATVAATHFHPDHLGLATEFRSRSGAPLIMHEREAEVLAQASDAAQHQGAAAAHQVLRPYALFTQQRLEDFQVPRERWAELSVEGPLPEIPQAQQVVADGQTLPIQGRDLRVVWTPGHTGGHMCLVEDATQVVFTADHVLPHINSGIGLGGDSPGNPIADYLTSLREVEQWDSYTVAPGHEYLFTGLAQRAVQLRTHHLRRAGEVADAMGSRASVWDIAAKVTWSEGFGNLRSYKLGSALSQVALHMDFVTHHPDLL